MIPVVKYQKLRKEETKIAEEQLVIFRLGKEEYAVSISEVREIIKYQSATRLPGTPSYIEGIINVRGKMIAVIELIDKLKLTTEKKVDRRAIIIDTAGQEFAIIVDEVTEVKRLSEAAIEVMQSNSIDSNKYIRGIGKDNGRLVILLDLETLLSSIDMNLLKEVS